MIPELKENKPHGTRAYPYEHYFIHGARHAFQIPVHWHEEMEIIYVKKGTLHIRINEMEYIGTDGDIYFVNPRELHLMDSFDLSIEYYTLLFPMEFISFQSMDNLELELLQPLRSNQLLIKNNVTSDDLLHAISPLLDEIIFINDADYEMKQLKTRILLLQILLHLYESKSMLLPSVSGNVDMQKAMLAYIEEHYTEKLSLAMMSQKFHLSEKYISRYFKEHFHISFSNYVMHLRLTLARQLLEATEFPVTEIALQAGFPNISYFIRSFKDVYKTTPFRYRKEKMP